MKRMKEPIKLYVLSIFMVFHTSIGHARVINEDNHYPNSKQKGTENQNGLFLIQFSWNRASYSDQFFIEIEYQKKKSKVSSKVVRSQKNRFVILELDEGDYEITALNLTGGELGLTKYLNIPFKKSFSTRAGNVTNGGLVFLTRENKNTDELLTLMLDNTEDVKKYISAYRPTYPTGMVQPAWGFLDKKKMDSIVNSYVKTLIEKESDKQRPNVTYLYATLGIVLRMEKDDLGKVLDYTLIPTPTHQHVTKISLSKDGTIICWLENGIFLYGDYTKLDYIKLPEGMESEPKIYKLNKSGGFILYDMNLNIFTAVDKMFNWTAHSQFRTPYRSSFFQASRTDVIFYEGPKNLYIYSTGNGKNKVLLQSGQEDITFKRLELSKEIDKISMVTETSTQLIIGPVLKPVPTEKKPAYIYVQNQSGEKKWKEQRLPFGDCYNLVPDKNNDTILYVNCEKSGWHQSNDNGKRWVEYKYPNDH